jgi:hypothetical protein
MNQNFINPKTCSGVPYNTVMADENIDVLGQYFLVKLKLCHFLLSFLKNLYKKGLILQSYINRSASNPSKL